MEPQPAPCLACETAVPAGTTTCPDCGYAVDSHDRWRLFLGGFGTLLSLSVVFAPVGLPLLWRANHHRVAASGSVTGRERRGIRDHLAGVLRQHLG